MQHAPLITLRRCIARYHGEHKVKTFSCLDQYLCVAFAQLIHRESLRNTETWLRAQVIKCYHTGLRGNVARNTLANANAVRDWRIYCDFAQRLIGIASSTKFGPTASGIIDYYNYWAIYPGSARLAMPPGTLLGETFPRG